MVEVKAEISQTGAVDNTIKRRGTFCIGRHAGVWVKGVRGVFDRLYLADERGVGRWGRCHRSKYLLSLQQRPDLAQSRSESTSLSSYSSCAFASLVARSIHDAKEYENPRIFVVVGSANPRSRSALQRHLWGSSSLQKIEVQRNSGHSYSLFSFCGLPDRNQTRFNYDPTHCRFASCRPTIPSGDAKIAVAVQRHPTKPSRRPGRDSG